MKWLHPSLPRLVSVSVSHPSLPPMSVRGLTVPQNLSCCQHSLHLTWSASTICVLNSNCITLKCILECSCAAHDVVYIIFSCLILQNSLLYNCDYFILSAFSCFLLSVCLFVCVLQVAEMHGELIEFNERLYRSLMAKDHLIVQMRQELIDLRGPVSDWTGARWCPLSFVFSAGFLFSLLPVVLPCHFLDSSSVFVGFSSPLSTFCFCTSPLLVFLSCQWLPITVNCTSLVSCVSFLFGSAALLFTEIICQSNSVATAHLFLLLCWWSLIFWTRLPIHFFY